MGPEYLMTPTNLGFREHALLLWTKFLLFLFCFKMARLVPRERIRNISRGGQQTWPPFSWSSSISFTVWYLSFVNIKSSTGYIFKSRILFFPLPLNLDWSPNNQYLCFLIPGLTITRESSVPGKFCLKCTYLHQNGFSKF